MPPETARYALEPPLPAFCTSGSETQHINCRLAQSGGLWIQHCGIVLLEERAHDAVVSQLFQINVQCVRIH